MTDNSKISNDPLFQEKLEDVVGLSMNPPENASVFWVDEKSSIPTLDGTQTGLPIKIGRAGTMTHDYNRHGTSTQFAALDVFSGEVMVDCKHRHRDQEFFQFLKTVEKSAPAELKLHVAQAASKLNQLRRTCPKALPQDSIVLLQRVIKLKRPDFACLDYFNGEQD